MIAIGAYSLKSVRKLNSAKSLMFCFTDIGLMRIFSMLYLYHMALTYLYVSINNPTNGHKAVNRKLLVDSGATYSVIPEKDLKKLGIKPDSKQQFTLANGQTITKSFSGMT